MRQLPISQAPKDGRPFISNSANQLSMPLHRGKLVCAAIQAGCILLLRGAG
jgi:hypothetical protein